MCNLWEIVTGEEECPDDYYVEEVRHWNRRDKIARILIKNLLNPRDYIQVQHIEHAADIWKILLELHQSTGAQGKVDLIWKFWSMRCAEGASVREHIGSVRTIHAELAEMGIVIEGYLLAIVLSKSLPSSYDAYVSTLFASIKDLEEADPNYITRKIFEEEQRRDKQSADVNITLPNYCANCKKPGHIRDDCYAKGGGKEGQGPRQIAWRKRQEYKKKQKDTEYDKGAQEQSAQAVENDVFVITHVEQLETSNFESANFTACSWSPNSWIADSGASTHIANQREMFIDYQPSNGVLNVAGGLTAKIEGTGTILMRDLVNGKYKDFKLTNVLHVPSTRYCLLSGPRIDKVGGRAEYGSGKCQFWNAKGLTLTTGKLVGNLYRINAKALINYTPMINLADKSSISWQEAHRRLGHLSLSSLKLLFEKNLVEGIEIDKNEVPPTAIDCESCILAKAHRAPFSNIAERFTKRFGDLTHTDVWGSPNVKQTPGGNKYFILFIDDFTRYITVKLMKDKSSVKQQLINYCTFVNTQHGYWPKEIRADNAAEYEGTRTWLEGRGIEMKMSATYSPQQNGVSERMNRTLLDLARAMKFEKKLPDTLWGEAVLHAAWIRNRSSTKILKNSTPIEVLTGKRPNLSCAREFGEEV